MPIALGFFTKSILFSHLTFNQIDLSPQQTHLERVLGHDHKREAIVVRSTAAYLFV